MHGFANDAQFGSLLPALLVVPRIHLQATLNEDGPAFFQVFARYLRQARPEDNIDIGDFLALFSTVGRVNAIHGDAEITDCTAFGRVTHFRIAGEISQQDDFVKTGHASVIAKSFRFR